MDQCADACQDGPSLHTVKQLNHLRLMNDNLHKSVTNKDITVG